MNNHFFQLIFQKHTINYYIRVDQFGFCRSFKEYLIRCNLISFRTLHLLHLSLKSRYKSKLKYQRDLDEIDFK